MEPYNQIEQINETHFRNQDSLYKKTQATVKVQQQLKVNLRSKVIPRCLILRVSERKSSVFSMLYEYLRNDVGKGCFLESKTTAYYFDMCKERSSTTNGRSTAGPPEANHQHKVVTSDMRDIINN